MLFQFAPVIQAGIDSGMYEVVRNTVTGQLLGITSVRVKPEESNCGQARWRASSADGSNQSIRPEY